MAIVTFRVVPSTLFILPSLLLSGCSLLGGQKDSYDGFKTDVDYKYEKITWVKQENVRTIAETYYSNSYVHFTQYNHHYRFSYIVNQGTMDFYYDDMGDFIYMNGDPLSTDYGFTLMDGVRVKGESAFLVSFTYVNNQLVGSMWQREQNKENTLMAKFSFTTVETLSLLMKVVIPIK